MFLLPVILSADNSSHTQINSEMLSFPVISTDVLKAQAVLEFHKRDVSKRPIVLTFFFVD